MASLVSFIETTSDKLSSLAYQDGRFVFTTDTRRLYRDTSDDRALISAEPVTFSIEDEDVLVGSSNVSVTYEDDTITIE